MVPTDFSGPSENASLYALDMAMAMKTDIHLCHAFSVPAESPLLSGVSWSLYDYPELLEDCNKRFDKLVTILKQKMSEDEPKRFQPTISYSCDVGDIAEVINNTAEKNNTVLIVMGMTGMGKLERLIMGSSSIRMIDTTNYPLLIVPYNQHFKTLKKIAFSTDLDSKDIKIAKSLVTFSQYFSAALLIAHIADFIDLLDEKTYQHRKDLFLKDIADKVTYLSIESDNLDSGFDQLKHRGIDMLVMGHRHKNFFDRLILGSYSARQAAKLELPLLVIPEGAHVSFEEILKLR